MDKLRPDTEDLANQMIDLFLDFFSGKMSPPIFGTVVGATVSAVGLVVTEFTKGELQDDKNIDAIRERMRVNMDVFKKGLDFYVENYGKNLASAVVQFDKGKDGKIVEFQEKDKPKPTLVN